MFPKNPLPIVCALASAVIAAISLLGWVLGIAHLTLVLHGLPRLVPMTALLVLGASLGLGWHAARPQGRRGMPAAPLLPAGGVLALSLAVLACYALGRAPAPLDFGGSYQLSPFSLASPVTAAMFVLLAVGQLGLGRARTLAQGQCVTLAGYLFRDTFLYALLPGKGTSVLTTLAFILLGIGTLVLRPREGIMVAVAGPDPGAWVARRLLLSALAMPVLLGALAAFALDVGAVDVGTTIAGLVWGTIALFTAVVWRFALVLYRVDAARGQAEREREAALARLRELDARKDDVMALLAHELRNPLAPIRAAADLLRIGHASDPAQLRRTSEIIGRQADHIAHLVDDLLDVSRVRRGLITLDKVPVDLPAAVQDAIEQVRPRLAARRHHLSADLPDGPLFVCGDHKRLVQVVANLLGNAVKYTPEGGHVRLALRADARQAGVRVQDDGIGIDAALLPHVFDAFTQGTRTAGRADGGLGLGLALVKRLAELHDGSVVAHSDGPGRGSSFVLTLPRLRDADAATLAQMADAEERDR